MSPKSFISYSSHAFLQNVTADHPRELMDALEAWGKMDDHKLHFNPATCSWEDMFRELEKAQKSLLGESGATGDGHRLPTQQKLSQKLWRGTSSVLNIFGPMLEAIPDEFGYIKGSLGVIFNVSS